MGTIFAVFQMCGIMLCLMEWLKMSVRTLMACGPKCCKCLFDMPSGPVEGACFDCLCGVSCSELCGKVRVLV